MIPYSAGVVSTPAARTTLATTALTFAKGYFDRHEYRSALSFLLSVDVGQWDYPNFRTVIKCYYLLEEYENALRYSEISLKRFPDMAIHSDTSDILRHLGRHSEADNFEQRQLKLLYESPDQKSREVVSAKVKSCLRFGFILKDKRSGNPTGDKCEAMRYFIEAYDIQRHIYRHEKVIRIFNGLVFAMQELSTLRFFDDFISRQSKNRETFLTAFKLAESIMTEALKDFNMKKRGIPQESQNEFLRALHAFKLIQERIKQIETIPSIAA